MSLIEVSESQDLLTLWRRNLVTHLTAQYPARHPDTNAVLYHGVKVQSGMREADKGGVDDHHLLCVFSPGFAEWEEDVHWALPQMFVRHYLPKSRLRRGDPPDPTPLEQASWRLATVLQPVQDSLMPAKLWFRGVQFEHDLDDWGVEATLTAFVRNPAAVAGA